MEPSMMMHHILMRKLEAYGDFLSTTLLLKEAIETGDESAVTRQLQRRDHLIRMIDGLDRQIGACALLPKQGAASGEKTRETTGELVRMLQQIISAHAGCESVAVDRLDVIRESLSMVHRTGNAMQGYARSVQRIPKFLNVQI